MELGIDEFYEKLKHVQELPTTSQVNPSAFEAVFKEYTDKGDEVVGLFISSKLSGTFQSAVVAKQSIESEKIHLVDTSSASFGLQMLVRWAVKLRDEGKSAKEIAQSIEELSKKIRFIAVLDTLKYLKMGGRLSATAALVGSVLGICPIITLTDGKVAMLGKARGQKGALQMILDYMLKNGRQEGYPVYFGHSNAPEGLEKCKKLFMPHLGDEEILTGDIGCIVGTHAGPGAIGVAYIEP